LFQEEKDGEGKGKATGVGPAMMGKIKQSILVGEVKFNSWEFLS
jgi:hypothetical protein